MYEGRLTRDLMFSNMWSMPVDGYGLVYYLCSFGTDGFLVPLASRRNLPVFVNALDPFSLIELIEIYICIKQMQFLYQFYEKNLT